jgi:diguanylate cyclase (GGDEF)-like protein
MKRHPIPFRKLLEEILPVEKLPPGERKRIASVLGKGDPAAVETIALTVLERLVDLGHLRLLEEVLQGEEKVRRYLNLSTADTIVLRLPVTDEDDGVQKIPLPLRDWRGGTSLDQVRTLFNLYNKILTRDSQLLRGPVDILRQVMLTTRQMMGCERVSFWSAIAGQEALFPVESLQSEAYDETLAEEWVLERRYLVVLPDLPAMINTETRTLESEFRSLAMVPLGEPDLGVYGVLHAWSMRPQFFREEQQGLLSLLSEFSTELFRRAQVLGDLVFVDAATQVYNRAYFNLQLENEIARARRDGNSLALAICDIDDFKAFNSKYGYEGGNQVLEHTAQILKRGLRPFDSVARWGGEEFALILTPPVSHEDAGVVCERLRRAVELSRFTITGLEGETKSVRLTITVGGAVYPEDGQTAGDLWRAANSALVHGKSEGKNRVLFASELPVEPEEKKRRKRPPPGS